MKNDSKKIIYITTNGCWSGSEELWTRSAQKMIGLGYSVSIASQFSHDVINALSAEKIPLTKHTSPYRKISEKLKIVKQHGRTYFLQKHFNNHKPDLVIISQGNNIDSLDVMDVCQRLGAPYITITQLVTESHLLYINNVNLPQYRKAYLHAAKNFFVSKKNLELNSLMFGLKLLNAEVIYNPCKLSEGDVFPFPSKPDIYSIALVGRIECFHKGYDLLINVLSDLKWKSRNVRFNIYGEGPHTDLLKENIELNGLTNVNLKGYANHIADVWKHNQLLCLPSRMEGQALALIEAMFCNRAAIVTDVGGAADLIKDGYNGFVAESASLGSLDMALERAWLKRQSWEELGLNAGLTIRANYPDDSVAFLNQKILQLIG